MRTGTSSSPQAVPQSVIYWLWFVCALIIAMVAVGGITRLTNSGLSIVEWKPLMGAIPPLSAEDWQKSFEQYQRFPQYKLLNQGMSLEQFKFIFFWEYIHRLLGRLIGIAFFIPWLYFQLRGYFARPLAIKLGIGFFLGGLQGALGWFMVKSGLVDRPHVSHYRLAAHLGLAFLVLSYLYWILIDLNKRPKSPAAVQSVSRDPLGVQRLTVFTRWIIGGISLQIIYGAFTAGLRAGFGFNTFPKMNGEWFPTGFFREIPVWLNIFENPIAVQFIHRSIGWLLLFSITLLWLYGRKLQLTRRQRTSTHALFAMTLLQFTLGVTTLLLVVPVSVATLHQVGACILLLTALRLAHSLKAA